MDIWIAAVVVVWLPVATALGVLVGRSLAHCEARERLHARLGRQAGPTAAPAVDAGAPVPLGRAAS